MVTTGPPLTANTFLPLISATAALPSVTTGAFEPEAEGVLFPTSRLKEASLSLSDGLRGLLLLWLP